MNGSQRKTEPSMTKSSHEAMVERVETAAIAKLWAMTNPQKTETYAEFKERDPIGWEEFEAVGASVARAALEALPAEKGVGAVPEGWKAVPSEPPWETLIAGRDALMDTDDEIDLSTDQVRECYRAMLASIKGAAHV